MIVSAGWSDLSRARPGSLVVLDDFGLNPGEVAKDTISDPRTVPLHHGEDVVETARQTGYGGDIYCVQGSKVIMPQPPTAAAPARARAQTAEGLAQVRASFLRAVGGQLTQAMASGAHNLAFSLSIGISEAWVAEFLAKKLDRPDAYGHANHRQAFELTGAASTRSQAYQWLVDTVAESSKSPEVIQARAEFAEVVRNLESRNNSVVICASNEGEVATRLAREAGASLRLSESFALNDLSCPSATLVGALNEEGTVAPYTSADPEIDIYADERCLLPTDDPERFTVVAGTSYATPRVAVALAEIHGSNRELSSGLAEKALAQQHTGVAGTGLYPARSRLQTPKSEEHLARSYSKPQRENV